MFEDDKKLDKIDHLARYIVREEVAVGKLKDEHTQRKEALDQDKENLAVMLREAGMFSCKLDCGLMPCAKDTKKYYAPADKEVFFKLLRDNGLDDIIVPHVHFQSLQSAMKAFEEQGGNVPEEFTISVRPTVTMRGKSLFIKENLIDE